MSGNATLEALSRYILPGTQLTLLETLYCEAAIGVKQAGIFKQLRKLKEAPLWDTSGLPVGDPWVGQPVAVGSSTPPSFMFVLKLRSTGGARAKTANPDNLNFDPAKHIKAALGDLLTSLDDFNSQKHLSSVAVVVIDKQEKIFLCFPCSAQPEFRYSLPPAAAATTCGKKRAKTTAVPVAQRPAKVLKSAAGRGVRNRRLQRSSSDEDDDDDDLDSDLTCLQGGETAMDQEGDMLGCLVDGLSLALSPAEDAEMEEGFDANCAFAKMGEGDVLGGCSVGAVTGALPVSLSLSLSLSLFLSLRVCVYIGVCVLSVYF